MAVRTTLAFAAGFVTGWAGRSAAASTRDALVHALAFSYGVRDKMKRLLAEERERFEDFVAEGRAHYEHARELKARHDESAPDVTARSRTAQRARVAHPRAERAA